MNVACDTPVPGSPMEGTAGAARPTYMQRHHLGWMHRTARPTHPKPRRIALHSRGSRRSCTLLALGVIAPLGQYGQSSYELRILSANPTAGCVSSAKLGARLPRELGAWLVPPSRWKPPVRTEELASGPGVDGSAGLGCMGLRGCDA